MTIGTVREWHDDEGWGVIDSSETPGGCWAHYATVAMTGYRALNGGDTVDFDWRSPGQDGFNYAAVKVWIGDRSNNEHDSADSPSENTSGAYNSRYTVAPPPGPGA